MSKKNTAVKSGLQLAAITPKTKNQKLALDAFHEHEPLLLSGCAGTGKTYLALWSALNHVTSGEAEKVVIVRSAVPVRDMGFLPGTEQEKIEVYERPYRDIVGDLFRRGDAYDLLKTKGIIEFIPTSFVRGITIKNTVIVMDEIQNYSFQELNSIMTRIGDGTKVILSGDTHQSDLANEDSGYYLFVQILAKMPNFGKVEFCVDDIVRSGLVREYIIAKAKVIRD